jgi:hypothetical protein
MARLDSRRGLLFLVVARDDVINFVQQQDVGETLIMNLVAKASLTLISFIASYVHKDLIFCLVNL